MEVLIYHLLTRAIEGKIIFPEPKDYERFLQLMEYYKYDKPLRFSHYLRAAKEVKNLLDINKERSYVEIIAYVLMPNHIHIIVEEINERGVLIFSRRILDSYTRYFNEKNKRKGTLYQHSIKKILIPNTNYLLHLTRYIHLNPCSAGLVTKPEEWPYSSYREYLELCNEKVCSIGKYFKMSPESYREFVEDHLDYQRSLEIIKALLKLK